MKLNQAQRSSTIGKGEGTSSNPCRVQSEQPDKLLADHGDHRLTFVDNRDGSSGVRKLEDKKIGGEVSAQAVAACEASDELTSRDTPPKTQKHLGKSSGASCSKEVGARVDTVCVTGEEPTFNCTPAGETFAEADGDAGIGHGERKNTESEEESETNKKRR